MANPLLEKYKQILNPLKKRLSNEIQINKLVAKQVGQQFAQGFRAIPENARFLREDPKTFANAAQMKVAYAKRLQPVTNFGIQQATNFARGVGGVMDIAGRNKTLSQRGAGALSLAGSVFGASPQGAILNYGQSSLAGKARDFRTGQQSSFTQGAAEDLLLSEGLGVTNPAIALGVDVLGGGLTDPQSFRGLVKGKGLQQTSNVFERASFKSAEKRIPNLRNVVQNVKGNQLEVMENFLDLMRARKINGRSVKLGSPEANDIEYAAHFLAEELGISARDVPNRTLSKLFDDVMAHSMAYDRGRSVVDAVGPNKLGFVGSKPDTSIIDAAKKQISSVETPKKPFKQNVRDFYQNWVNRFQPVEDLASSIEKKTGSKLIPSKNPTYTFKRLLGAGAIAEQRHKRELQPIIDQLGDVDKSDFDVFLKAQRDLELAARDVKGSDAVQAQRILDELNRKYDPQLLQSVSKQLYAYQAKNLQGLKDAGFLTDEAVGAIEDANKFYVPFQRIMDEVDNYIGLPAKTAQQGTNPIRKIKGSERAIVSPLESIIANTYRTEAAISKNNAAKSVINLKNVAPEYADLFKQVDKSSDSTITIWDGGQKLYFDVGEPIAEAVKGLNEENTNTLVKLLSAPASLLRQGATGRNIDFMIPNVFKDQFDAAVNSQYGYVPFVDYLRGLGHLIKYKNGGDALVEEWINSGGKIFFEKMGGRKSIKQLTIESAGKERFLSKIGRWVTGGLDVIGEYSETPTRIGAFRKALQKTGNRELAMAEARDITLDFGRMGAKMKVANSIIPFLNVGVQGFDKMIRTARNNPGKFAAVMTAYVGMPATILSLYNNQYHGEAYSRVPQYEKDGNFILMMGEDAEGKPQYMKIPNGNVAQYVAAPIDNLVTWLYGNDSQSFMAMSANLLAEALPIVEGGEDFGQATARTVGSLIPQAIKPAVESAANSSFFYNEPIVPQYLMDEAPEDRFKKGTPEVYKRIGQVAGVSPLQVQNLSQGYLAGFATQGTNTASVVNQVASGDPVDVNKVPIVRRFVGSREKYVDDREPPKSKPFLERLGVAVKPSEAGASSDFKLPTDKKTLTKLASDDLAVMKKYYERKAEIQFGQYESESKREEALEKLESDTNFAVERRNAILRENPELEVETALELDKVTSMPAKTLKEKIEKETAAYGKVEDIVDSNLTREQKQQAFKTLGLKENDAVLYYVAKAPKEVQLQFLAGQVKDATGNDLVKKLASFRAEVNGERILDDDMIDDFYDAEIITAAEKKYLKGLKWNPETKKVEGKKSGSGSKKLKKLVIPKPSAIKVSRDVVGSRQTQRQIPTSLIKVSRTKVNQLGDL